MPFCKPCDDRNRMKNNRVLLDYLGGRFNWNIKLEEERKKGELENQDSAAISQSRRGGHVELSEAERGRDKPKVECI